MKRIALTTLLAWKNQPTRKPLLLDGARQTGKSYLLETLFGEHFEQVIKLDFLEHPSLNDIFEGSLKPADILMNIELRLGITLDLDRQLIIFDEIGESQPALDALKFFAEQYPQIYLCASGSNIGLLKSFPVGKVELMQLYPMTFEEFLLATNDLGLYRAFEQMNMSKIAHGRLFDQLLDYYFVGGMPEAVSSWFANAANTAELGINERIVQIKQIHQSLIAGYERDFGKYSDKLSAQHIQAIFTNVPVQLAKTTDDSVKRFQFKGIIDKKNRYQALSGPIHWLEKCRLVSKCHPIDCRPSSPLAPLAKDNIFKLFLFDIGLLGHMLSISYQEHRAQGYQYKSYIAENFVHNELVAMGYRPTYSWEMARAEIEFLYKNDSGDIIPVEVKSGKRTQAKSLRSYIDKYQPKTTLKLVGTTGSTADLAHQVWPLYYTAKINRL